MLEWIEWIGILPVLGLTGNWRGYRMGGKAIGGASMSTDMKKKFEAARASGNMDQARAMADKAQEIKDKRKSAAEEKNPKLQEQKRIYAIAEGVREKSGEAAKKAREDYFNSHPAFDPKKDYDPNRGSIADQQSVHAMARNKRAGEAASAAAEKVREREAEKLPEKDRYLAGAKKYPFVANTPAPTVTPTPQPSSKPSAKKTSGKKKAEGKSAQVKGNYVQAGNGTLTGSKENDQRLQLARSKQSAGRLSGSEESSLKLNEARAKADPNKWKPNEGVGYRVISGGTYKQTNRGFRIVSIDPNTKTAVIRQVADTGLTSSGGNNDRIAPQTVHIADLVRDSKYGK